jgi:Ni/Co efflux regulator RcnB
LFSTGIAPGLAKKHDGCHPPGQAKKWREGELLPHGVIYYDLPYDMVEHMGPPPRGHRYVRVASDILLIAIGTGMVVDAIDDLVD